MSLLVRIGGVSVGWADRSTLGPDGAGGADGPALVVRAGDPAEVMAAALAAQRSAGRACVVVVAEPVTDTLKQVDDDGTVRGTADRDRHRLVGTPLAAPLGALLAVRAADPTPAELLAELAAAGLPIIPL